MTLPKPKRMVWSFAGFGNIFGVGFIEGVRGLNKGDLNGLIFPQDSNCFLTSSSETFYGQSLNFGFQGY